MLKRTLLILSLVTLLVTGFAFAGPRPVSAASTVCVAFDVLLRNDLPFSATATIAFILPFPPFTQLTPTQSLTLAPGEVGYLRLVADLSVPPPYILGGGPGGLTILGVSNFGNVITPDNCSGGGISDGRINNGGNQLGAPVAIYCSAVGDGGIDVYDIDPSSGDGTLAFRASGADVDAGLAAAGGGSALIAEGLGDQLWATAGGDLSVTGPDLNGEGKTYRFDFAGDTCG